MFMPHSRPLALGFDDAQIEAAGPEARKRTNIVVATYPTMSALAILLPPHRRRSQCARRGERTDGGKSAPAFPSSLDCAPMVQISCRLDVGPQQRGVILALAQSRMLPKLTNLWRGCDYPVLCSNRTRKNPQREPDISRMSTTHVVSALREKRAAFGRSSRGSKAPRKLRDDLDAIDRTLRIFDPSQSPENITPVVKRKGDKLFAYWRVYARNHERATGRLFLRAYDGAANCWQTGRAPIAA